MKQKTTPTYQHIYNGKTVEFEVVDALMIETRPSNNKSNFAIKKINKIPGIINLHHTYKHFSKNIKIYQVTKNKIDHLINTIPDRFKYFIRRVTKVYKSGDDIFYGTGRLILMPKTEMTKENLQLKLEKGEVIDGKNNIFLINYTSDIIADKEYIELKDKYWIKFIEKDFSTTDKSIIDPSNYIPDHTRNTTPLPEQEAYKTTKTFDAHALFEGSPSIKIAILDTGVDPRHPDLKNYFELERSWDFVNNRKDQRPNKKDYHGTCCAGLAMANKSNTVGINGVGKGCSLTSYKIGFNDYHKDLNINLYSIIKALLVAGFEEQADVISCSWSFKKEFTILAEVIRKVYKEGRNGKGTVVVFSAGNDEKNTQFPGNMPEVITVSALDIYDIPKKKTSRTSNTIWGSNFGDEVDIAAPGEELITTDILYQDGAVANFEENYNYFKHFQGTSAAAPQVAGCAALMLSINPDLTSDKVKEIIKSESLDFKQEEEQNYGQGILNVLDAVIAAKNHQSL